MLPPGWANPIDLDQTALINSAASISLLGEKAKAKLAAIQETSKMLLIPNGADMKTTKTLELLLHRLPHRARRSFRCPGITNNLLAVCELCDAGCTVTFREHGCDVEYEGEIILRGWRDWTNNLWRVPLTSEGEGNNVIPPTPKEEYHPAGGDVFQVQINNVLHECEGVGELIRFFHAALFSPPKSTLRVAIKRGYLRGCPGLTEKRVEAVIKVEDATVMGRLR